MDPPGPGVLGGSLVSPGGSRVSLPLAVAGGGESLFSSLTSPPANGTSTGASAPDPTGRTGERREVFSDFKRFVSFGLRKDASAPP